METNKPLQTNNEQKKSNVNKILVLIIALLTIFCGVLLWQFLEQKKTTTVEVAEKQKVIEEKDALSVELENMLQEYESLKSDNTAIQAELDQQKQQIERLLADVEKHKGNAVMMAKYKKETVTLRSIMQNYVVTIDSLNTLNQNLNQENVKVRGELGQQQTRYEELNKEKESLTKTVAVASQLDALSPNAAGVYYKSNGKEIETNKAKKAEKIKVCFTLSENKIAKKGPKDIYVRIISPDGKILAEGADESYMFTYDGIRGVYSAKKTMDYNNEQITGCTSFKIKEGANFPEGKYIAEIYADEANIGTVSFEMK